MVKTLCLSAVNVSFIWAANDANKAIGFVNASSRTVVASDYFTSNMAVATGFFGTHVDE